MLTLMDSWNFKNKKLQCLVYEAINQKSKNKN